MSSRENIFRMTKSLVDVVSSITTRPAACNLVVAELISQTVKDGSEAYKKPFFFFRKIWVKDEHYEKYASQSDDSNVGLNGKSMNKGDVER